MVFDLPYILPLVLNIHGMHPGIFVIVESVISLLTTFCAYIDIGIPGFILDCLSMWDVKAVL